MNHLPTLTKARRDEILARLTPVQRQALNQFTMYEMKSWFHTKIFQTAIDWEFQGVAIDPFYQQERSRPADSGPLFCNCGRQIKYQYIIKSRATGISKHLGISHFTQEAGIPQSVANEIMKGLNKIQLYADPILIAYQRGRRFPREEYRTVLGKGGFDARQHPTLAEKCVVFCRANLPLYVRDKWKLDALYRELTGRLALSSLDPQTPARDRPAKGPRDEFPHKLYGAVASRRGFNNQRYRRLGQRCADFRAVNLPLLDPDMRELIRCYEEVTGKPYRPTGEPKQPAQPQKAPVKQEPAKPRQRAEQPTQKLPGHQGMEYLVNPRSPKPWARLADQVAEQLIEASRPYLIELMDDYVTMLKGAPAEPSTSEPSWNLLFWDPVKGEADEINTAGLDHEDYYPVLVKYLTSLTNITRPAFTTKRAGITSAKFKSLSPAIQQVVSLLCTQKAPIPVSELTLFDRLYCRNRRAEPMG